jgi:3-oxoacyl-[acyl-carrier protein] reductase
MMRDAEKANGAIPDPELLKKVEENHGDPIGIGPVVAFLASPVAARISGIIICAYASGQVKLYSEPKCIREISKRDGLWTIGELEAAFHEQLLGPGYVSSARGGWGE